ncbi:MAG: hypothetical protein LRY67_03710 [Gammaproteobacteria bacterium]|nr:hypothetical protein [Gammaproteobacteria bacterium]
MQEKNVCIVPISHSNNYLSKEDLALFIAGLNHASEGYIIEIPSDIESHKHDIDNCIYLTIVNDHLYCKTHLTPNHNWVVLEGPFFDKGNIFYQKILTKNVSTIDENDRQNLFQVLEQKNYIYQKYDHVAFVLTGELARFTRAIHSPLSPIDRRDPTVIEDSSAIDNQWKEAHETIINRLTIPFSFSTWDMWTKNDQLSQPLERIKEKYLAGSHQNLLMNPETEIDSINSDTSDEFDQSDSIFAAAIDERLRQVSNGIGRKNKYDPSKGSIRRFNLENTIGMAKKYIFEELALISLWANPGLLSESGLRVTMLYPFEGEPTEIRTAATLLRTS